MEEHKIKSAIVTGATGLNGATLVEKLADESVEVFAVCRSGSTRMENIIKRDNVHIVECNKERQNPPLTKGEQEWDYLYVEDAANALWRMAKFGKDGAIYVLGSRKTMPLRKYMEIIRDIISPETKLRIGEKPYYKDQAMYLSADISTLTKDTGWTPKFSFEEGIRKILNER